MNKKSTNVVITGDWDGEPIWRYKNSNEKLLEMVNELKNGKL